MHIRTCTLIGRIGAVSEGSRVGRACHGERQGSRQAHTSSPGRYRGLRTPLGGEAEQSLMRSPSAGRAAILPSDG